VIPQCQQESENVIASILNDVLGTLPINANISVAKEKLATEKAEFAKTSNLDRDSEEVVRGIVEELILSVVIPQCQQESENVITSVLSDVLATLPMNANITVGKEKFETEKPELAKTSNLYRDSEEVVREIFEELFLSVVIPQCQQESENVVASILSDVLATLPINPFVGVDKEEWSLSESDEKDKDENRFKALLNQGT
jgi:pantothenate kinase type III